MTRLPIRLKLTLAFAGAMTLLLALAGSFLFYRTKSNLDEAIRDSLRTRGGALAAFAAAAPATQAHAIEPGDRYAQLLAPSGQILESRPPDGARMLTRGELLAAQRGPTFVERPETARLYAQPTRLHGARVVAVVGASLADRERALEGLGTALFIGGPIALLIASGIGYALATAALGPVESMRRRAEGISRVAPDARLPVPTAQDEIRRLGETLNDMLARLEASAAHERSFVAHASHELRTPLATLRAELELALRHGDGEASYREALEGAIADADRLAALADELLVVARADDGQPVRRDPIDLRALFASVAAEFRHRPETATRDIRVDSRGARLIGEESSIRRALLNLVDNALVHGGGDVLLEARTDPSGDVRITVTNGGASLDEDLRSRAFDRFTHGPRAGKPHGAGLGLSIVRAVAEAHGGEAWIANRPEGGVEVGMRFPGRADVDRGHPATAGHIAGLDM